MKILKLLLLSSLLLQASCDIMFKRKNMPAVIETKNISLDKVKKENQSISKSPIHHVQKKRDIEIISSYYADPSNEMIRKNMISYTSITKKEQAKLVVGKIISRELQVVPLPLILERDLSSLPLNMIRVQVGANIILMNVKTRQILDLVKI
ncbi:MAG: hypothetical protein QM484_01865 [Woeseiaceae bacterium]